MAFLVNCPNCGDRNVYEFRFGGEIVRRPDPGDDTAVWMKYFYARRNAAGEQKEWWYHSLGCRRWFVAERDTRTNAIGSTGWPGEVQA